MRPLENKKIDSGKISSNGRVFKTREEFDEFEEFDELFPDYMYNLVKLPLFCS